MFPLFFFLYIEPVRGFLVGRAPLPEATPSGSAVLLSRFELHRFLVRSSLVRCCPGRAPWVPVPYRVLLSFYTRCEHCTPGSRKKPLVYWGAAAPLAPLPPSLRTLNAHCIGHHRPRPPPPWGDFLPPCPLPPTSLRKNGKHIFPYLSDVHHANGKTPYVDFTKIE